MKNFLLTVLLIGSYSFLSAQTKTGFSKTWVFMASLVEFSDTGLASFDKEGRIDSKILNFFKNNGVPPNQIIYLKDKQASTNSIRAEFANFLKRATKGDKLFLLEQE